jgi:hypothetical protein
MRSRRQPISSNKYLRALLAPWDCDGDCRVPDILTFPSCTFQAKGNFTIPCDSSGTGGIVIGPRPFAFLSTFGGSGDSWQDPVNIPQYDAVADAYKDTRPVSLGIRCSFIGNTLYDQGQLYAGILARGQTAPGVSPTSFGSLPNVQICPLRNGIQMIWKPQDSQDTNYANISDTSGIANIVDGAVSANTTPCLALGIVGAQASSTPLLVEWWMNLEAIPTVNTSLINKPSTSRADSRQFEEATNVVGDVPTAQGIGTDWSDAAKKLAATLANQAILEGTTYLANEVSKRRAAFYSGRESLYGNKYVF